MTPSTHAQWLPLDFQKLLAHAAFINMDSQNSILDPSGCLKHEGLWKRARDEGGTLANTLKLAAACRKAGMPFVWLRYDRFIGETEPTNEMDRVQYNFWNKDYSGDRARKAWECDLVPEVKAILQPEDMNLVYPGWSIFTGTGWSAGSTNGASARFSFRVITLIGVSRWLRATRASWVTCRSSLETPAARRNRCMIRRLSRSTTAMRL